jgi:imidazolonepropionase-like amidohydrolase
VKKILFIAFLFFCFVSSAQNPAPVPDTHSSILIMNGTAHIGNGQVIENSAIGIDSGKIVLIADATRIRLDESAYKTKINAFGKHIYPGLIACNSTIGLTEIDLVRATRDINEVGELKPNIRSIIAYNTDSKIPPTVRSNGVLLAQVVPQGGRISGQSSVVELDAWNWEDAAYKTDEGIHLNWPRMYVVNDPNSDKDDIQRQNIQKELNSLDLLFKDALSYSQSTPQEKNLRLESMKGLFNGSKKLYIHCDFIKEIISAIEFVKKYKLKMVLVSGTDAFMAADLLKANDIPVLLGNTHSLPPREDEDVTFYYKLPALLQQAGITFAQSVDGSWQARNLAFCAGTSVGYGLTKEQALMSITLSAAKILGIDKTVGSLEMGKDATLVISTGDILDMRTNNIEAALIRGKQINLDDVQKQLYRKYTQKYGQ